MDTKNTMDDSSNITDILNFLQQASKGHVVSLLEDIIYHGVTGHGDVATPTQLVVAEPTQLVVCDVPRRCFTILRENVRFIISNETIWNQEFNRAISRLKSELEENQCRLSAFEVTGSASYYDTAEKIVNSRRELEMLLRAVQEAKHQRACKAGVNYGSTTDGSTNYDCITDDSTNYDKQWALAGMVNGFILENQFVGLIGDGQNTTAFAADVELYLVDFQVVTNIRSITAEEVLQLCTKLPIAIFAKYFYEDFPTGNLKIRKETQGDVILIARNDTSLVVPRSTMRLYCNPEFHTIEKIEHNLNTELTPKVAEFLEVILTACNGRQQVPEFTPDEVRQIMSVQGQLGFNFEQ